MRCSARVLVEEHQGFIIQKLLSKLSQGMHRRRSTCTSSNSDSDSSDEVVAVVPERYAALRLQQGLENWPTRRRAVQELTAITSNVYKAHATKTTQNAIFLDIMRAVQLCDRRAACRAAVDELVRAAKRVLPQQKRQQVHSEHSRAALASKRAEKRHHTGQTGEVGEDDGEAEGVEPLFDLPLPAAVVGEVLGHLDPVARARAACVCRSWRELSADVRMWDAWGRLLYPKQAKPGTSFAALVAADPRPVQRFRACRAQLGRATPPVWWDCATQQPWGSTQGGSDASSTPAKLIFPTVHQVVAWLLGSTSGLRDKSSSGRSSSESASEDDAVESEAVKRLRMWALPAVLRK